MTKSASPGMKSFRCNHKITEYMFWIGLIVSWQSDLVNITNFQLNKDQWHPDKASNETDDLPVNLCRIFRIDQGRKNNFASGYLIQTIDFIVY